MKKLLHLFRPVMYLSLCVLTFACSSTSYEQNVAQDYQANLQTVRGMPFLHKVYVNKAAFTDQTDERKQRFLHVYIGGDGRPYIGDKVSGNPTPINPLLLGLMAQDQQPAIYLGRPCYFSPQDSQCNKSWWTLRRYHEQVISSMISALSHYSQRYDHIVLIGYSGGGALAMLMAEKLKQAKILVTIAGNLDIFEWTTFHQYTPLMDSINPADLPPLPRSIIQIHYAGEKDKNILPDWIKSVSDKQTQSEYHLIENADHSCCWRAIWPDVLEKIASYETFIN